jgi:hypothetical protein
MKTLAERLADDAEADQLAARIDPSGCLKCGATSREQCRFPFAGLAGRPVDDACRYPPKRWIDPVRTLDEGFEFSEENCPGHVAAAHDPKVCGRCGVHVDSFRPDEQGP